MREGDVISPAVAKKARDSSGYHVRLRVLSVVADEGYDAGQCTANVVVARLCRVDGALPVGQTTLLEGVCFVPPDGSPTGPTWLDFSQLREGASWKRF
jgi:hypothetical protein